MTCPLCRSEEATRQYSRFVMGEITPDEYAAWVTVNLYPPTYLDIVLRALTPGLRDPRAEAQRDEQREGAP